MGKLLKPKNRRHLSELDAYNAAEGGTSRRIEKHLDRCGPCRNRVEHLRAAAERQRAYEREQAAKRSIRSVTTRRAHRLPSDVIDVNRPRLLSGAEWDRMKALAGRVIDESVVGYAIIFSIIPLCYLCSQFPAFGYVLGALSIVVGLVFIAAVCYMLYRSGPGDNQT